MGIVGKYVCLIGERIITEDFALEKIRWWSEYLGWKLGVNGGLFTVEWGEWVLGRDAVGGRGMGVKSLLDGIIGKDGFLKVLIWDGVEGW